MNTLGERVRTLRTRQKLSQQEFADTLGISQSFLSDIERDIKMPGGDVLLSLKRSFDTSIDWLLAGELEVFDEGEPAVGVRKKMSLGGDDRVRELQERVTELERENLLLNGQITAYREMMTTLNR